MVPANVTPTLSSVRRIHQHQSRLRPLATGSDSPVQFRTSVTNLPWGFTWSNNFLYHSGLAYPVYIHQDLNGDGMSNQGVGTNDRPTIMGSNGKISLLSEYPTRQPNYFAWDMRISKDINFKERYQVRLSMDLFNVTNRGNLQSDPDNSAFVPFGAGCTLFPGSVTTDLTTCNPLTHVPNPAMPPDSETPSAPSTNCPPALRRSRFSLVRASSFKCLGPAKSVAAFCRASAVPSRSLPPRI